MIFYTSDKKLYAFAVIFNDGMVILCFAIDFSLKKVYNDKVEIYGRLAQLVEHSLDVRRVSGSSPLTSTKNNRLIMVC